MKKTALTLALVAGVFSVQTSMAQQAPRYPALPSETPEDFKAPVDSFDYIRRTVMIPMRDGVKLNTILLIPRKARHAPMLLTEAQRSRGN